MNTNILIVDDVAENLVTLEALLARGDIEILKACSSREALELLLVEDVALALIDVQMPETDGFELAQLMRGAERTRQIPIVFLTAGSQDEQQTFEGYSAGGVDFLYKPLQAHVLRSKVDVFVQLYRHKRQLADQLEAHREMLRLNELLTAAIGHDLRNPLNAVVGAAEIILQNPSGQRVAWAAERIKSGGVRMARLIEQLLDFSAARLQGGLPVNPSSMDLLEAAKRVIAEHRLADGGAKIRFEHQGDLKCVLDQERIAQLLSNLIGNAIVHGQRDDGVDVWIDGAAEEVVVLRVANKGNIPEELLPRIFDPFKTSAGHSHQSSGLGLGLYIVDQIVKTHGGTIDVKSTMQTGTTFMVTLPRRCGKETLSPAGLRAISRRRGL